MRKRDGGLIIGLKCPEKWVGFGEGDGQINLECEEKGWWVGIVCVGPGWMQTTLVSVKQVELVGNSIGKMGG